MSVDAVTSDQEMRDRGLSVDADPHSDDEILRYLRQSCALSLSDAADRIQAVFGYDCSKSMVRRGIKSHDIRDPVNDGAFADVLEDGEDTEPAQPPSFLLERSEGTSVHPFDCDEHWVSENDEGGWVVPDDENHMPTLHFRGDSNPDSVQSPTETVVSHSGSGTGVYKWFSDLPPSAYRVSRPDRDKSLIAPPGTHPDRYNDQYQACGCGSCDERHFLDGDDGAIDCPTPVPVTIAGARRIYEHTEGTNAVERENRSHVKRGEQKYARLMKADSAILRADTENTDRYVATDYDDWTVGLVSLRVSPTDDENRLVTPFVLVEDCLDAWREARDKLPRDEYEMFVHYWLGTGTDQWATPHIHCVVWVADPDDIVAPRDFREAVRTFVQSSTFAQRRTHFESDDPMAPLKDGTVRIEHSPLLANPDRLGERVSPDNAFSDVLGNPPERLSDGKDVQTRAAIYVGTQHIEFALKGSERPAHTEAAAFFDAVKNQQTSRGAGGFYRFADALDVLNSDQHSSKTNSETAT